MAQGFPLMSLPPELRLQIYEHALPARIVPIFAVPMGRRILPERSFEIRYVEHLFTHHIPLTPTPLRSVNREIRRFVTTRTKDAIEARESPPLDTNGIITLLHPRANPSSPGSRIYERVLGQFGWNFRIVAPETDVYFLRDYPEFPPSAIDTMVRWLNKRSLTNLKRLAIFYHTWWEAVAEGYLAALREFAGLEELWIVFSGNEGGDVVDKKEAKKEVTERLRELADMGKGWKVPMVRLADDEQSLEELVRH